jgi:hypothetical protein
MSTIVQNVLRNARIVTCFSDLKGRHHEVCEAQTRMAGCHCGVWIKALDLVNHKSIECPMTLIPCAIFRDIGMCVESCNGTIKRGVSTIHLGSNAALIKALHLKNQSLQNSHRVRKCFFQFCFLFNILICKDSSITIFMCSDNYLDNTSHF